MTDGTAEQTLGRRLGPYELIREAGRGGMSIVYEAVDSRDGRLVALKVLAPTPHLSDEEQQKHLTRLRREADAVSHLNHPNLVRVLDQGTVGETQENQTHYLVLEYVAGETLSARLARTGPLPLAETTAIAEQIAGALDAAHAAGVVHRDVKPGNIMVEPDGTAKLMDFGAARLLNDSEVTHSGTIIGSPAYMSPEQAKGEPVTAASDQWSLAAVLYAMLAGRSPFAAENVPATLYQVAHGVAGPIPDVSPAVMRVFARAFDHDPGLRYPSGAALVAAFRDALAARKPAAVYSVATPPIVPVASAPVPQKPKPRQANPLPVWLPLAAVALLVGFLFAATLRQRNPQTKTVASATTPSEAVPSPVPTAVPNKITAPPGPRARRERVAARPKATPSPARSSSVAVSSEVVTPSPTKSQSTSPRRPVPTPRPSVLPSPVAIIAERQPPATPRPRPLASVPRVVTQAAPTPFSAPVSPVEGTATSALKPAPEPVPALPTPAPPAAVAPEKNTPKPTPEPVKVVSEPETDENLSFLGTWRGTHTGTPATLVIKNQNAESDAFEGTLTVQTAEGPVTLEIKGRLYDDKGRPEVVLEEKRVISPSTARAWDLGKNTGFLTSADTMSGSGRDRRGRTYSWSFQR